MAFSAELYKTPTTPEPVGQVSVSGIGETTMPQLVVTVLLCESTTWATKLYTPSVLGVPVIAPVEALSVNPGGREPLTIENV
jgi:hypothetical protein